MKNNISQQLDKISDRFKQFSEDFKKNPVKAVVNLVKNGWHTVKSWIENSWLGSAVKKGIALWRDGWSTIKSWIENSWLGGAVKKGIGIIRSGWSYVSTFVRQYLGGAVEKAITLTKNAWSNVKDWVNRATGGRLEKAVTLTKHLWTTVKDWVEKNIGGVVEIGIKFVVKGMEAAGKFLADIPDNWLTGMGFKAEGGYFDGSTWKQFANGGYIKGNNSGYWNSIPQYAGGTTATHGSLFVAGEAGAEVVGHIGGQTEVLNKSQISAAMENATVKGMAQFLDVWKAMTSQITTCTNAIIRAIVITDTAKNNVINENSSTMYQTSDVSRSVYDSNKNTYQNNNSNFSQEMRDFYTEYIEPTLKEIASDTKRQADKKEQTIVTIGNKTINDAVVTQQNANGYVFTK